MPHPHQPDDSKQQLSHEQVTHVARLARLALTEEQTQVYRSQLARILDYMEPLRELDLSSVEPMSHPHDLTNRMDEDEPAPGLDNESLMRLAPDTAPPFIKVPRVLANDAGA